MFILTSIGFVCAPYLTLVSTSNTFSAALSSALPGDVIRFSAGLNIIFEIFTFFVKLLCRLGVYLQNANFVNLTVDKAVSIECPSVSCMISGINIANAPLWTVVMTSVNISGFNFHSGVLSLVSSKVSIYNCQFDGASTTRAIEARGGGNDVTVSSSSFSGAFSPSDGGAIYSDGLLTLHSNNFVPSVIYLYG